MVTQGNQKPKIPSGPGHPLVNYKLLEKAAKERIHLIHQGHFIFNSKF